MSLSGLSEVFNLGSKILDKLFPDPTQKQAAQIELLRLEQSGQLAQLDSDMKLALAQNEVNKQEAASTNWFVAGWRPFVGWVCGLGLAYQFLVRPIAIGITGADFPSLDMGTLATLLAGMLGLGGMRMTEKIQGVART